MKPHAPWLLGGLPALQAQAVERRLFTADQPAPPSQLRPGRTLLQVGSRPARRACAAPPQQAIAWRPGACWRCPRAWRPAGAFKGFSLKPDPRPHPTRPSPHNPPEQDLICAGMHSRAAYGFPAAAGMMSTVADYIKLQTIQPLT